MFDVIDVIDLSGLMDQTIVWQPIVVHIVTDMLTPNRIAIE